MYKHSHKLTKGKFYSNKLQDIQYVWPPQFVQLPTVELGRLSFLFSMENRSILYSILANRKHDFKTDPLKGHLRAQPGRNHMHSAYITRKV